MSDAGYMQSTRQTAVDDISNDAVDIAGDMDELDRLDKARTTQAGDWERFYEPTSRKTVTDKDGTERSVPEWAIRGCFGIRGLRADLLTEWLLADSRWPDEPMFVMGNSHGQPTGELWGYDTTRGLWVKDKAARQLAMAKMVPELDEVWRCSIFAEVLDRIRAAPTYDFMDMVPSDVNVRNGMLDWRTGEVRPHHPSYRSAVQLPVEYVDGAANELWLSHLDKVLPDDGARNVIQEFVGASLIPGLMPQQSLFMEGEGKNGKSVLLDVWKRLVGAENVTAVPFGYLDLSRNRFAAAQLVGKLANLCADIESDEMRNTSMWKNLTGGDVVFAENKGKDGFAFTNTAVLAFSCNRLPVIKDASFGAWRRVSVVTFGTVISEAEKIAQYADKIVQHGLAGVLSWALEGARRLDSKEWQIDDDPTGRKQAWQDQSNPAGAAARTLLHRADPIEAKDAKIDQAELNRVASAWATEHLGVCVTSRDMATEMDKLGFPTGKSGGSRVRRGCVWTDEGEDYRTWYAKHAPTRS